METGLAPIPLNEKERVQEAIDRLVAEIRADRSGTEEINALIHLISQLRNANQNLVLAALRAQVQQEEAEALNRRQNEFLAMLAHELRNPMAPISNAASLLEKIIVAHPLLPQIQGVISRQVAHMVRLLDDLLDASRITRGKVDLQKACVSLNDVIAQSVEVSRPFIEKRHQQLDLEPVKESILLDADLVRLAQVFSNLLINASKFTPERGHISLKVERRSGEVVVAVRDNGKGIEQELQPHIFSLFMQGPRSLDRSEGGLGIGLAIAKALVEMHGGKITVKSDGPGCGSEFSVTLPALDQSVPRNTSTTSSFRQDSAAPRCRILLIEDNADANATLQAILELNGHVVVSAFDGMTGLSLIKEQAFDVVICDIGLPGISGFEVIRQMRQQLSETHPIAIALSGYCQQEDRERAIEAGFDDYLIKPVQGDYLLHLIAARLPLDAGRHI